MPPRENLEGPLPFEDLPLLDQEAEDFLSLDLDEYLSSIEKDYEYDDGS